MDKSVLGDLKPQPLWHYFEEICKVPRPSNKEEKIRRFLLQFAHRQGLECREDEVGNIVICKEAFPGYENVPVVTLQTHMDMVCEKNGDVVFDFENDAIRPVIEGGWVKADGTTLGGDNGIGIAAQMAVLVDKELKHGPLECLITVGEETGLNGAESLKPGFFEGRILLNLDSEDDGELFIGCAGGIDTVAELDVVYEKAPANATAVEIVVKGLQGGHSGDDINKGRGNAIKILARFLRGAARSLDIGLSVFEGGNLRNAIAREARALVVVPTGQEQHLFDEVGRFTAEVRFEFERTDAGLAIEHRTAAMPEVMLTAACRDNFLNMLAACPHGVLSMSPRMNGMVETSTNLASVKSDGASRIVITTSQRSELESRKIGVSRMVEAVFELAGARVSHSDGYPGWTPNPDSYILKVTAESYGRLFGVEPVVRSIHAGLECGILLNKFPDLDMISFGPTIRNPHSPDEKVQIDTVEKFWLHLTDLLRRIADSPHRTKPTG